MSKDRGLYKKYEVTRLDGKHPDARYFVLDIDNDPFARTALAVYAAACKYDYPQLSADLFALVFPEKDK